MVGVWKKDKADNAIEFKSDGTYNLLDLKNPDKKGSQDITVSNRTIKDVAVKYRTTQISSIKFIEYEYKAEGYAPIVELVRYKIEKGLLYLTREKYVKVKGVSTKEDIQEVYTRVNWTTAKVDRTDLSTKLNGKLVLYLGWFGKNEEWA